MPSTPQSQGLGRRIRKNHQFDSWKFSEGEHVFCFEPDGHKAHVLYDAQILRRCVGTDSLARSWPEYNVHFLRWSSKWDRVVPECFLLAKCPANKSLKAAVRHIINSGSKLSLLRRNELLEKLLRSCLPMPPIYCNYEQYPFGPEKLRSRMSICNTKALEKFMEENFHEQESECNKDFDTSFMVADTPAATRSIHSFSDRLAGDSTPRSTPERILPRHLDRSFWAKQSSSEFAVVADDVVTSVSASTETTVTIRIPERLKDLLGADWTFVVHNGNCHNLPATPSIAEILSRFQSYSIDNVCNGSPNIALSLPAADVQSLTEYIVESIRSLFNVICGDLLLYPDCGCSESTQYSQFNFFLSKNGLSTNVTPSDVYGAWHLLRFFVRFPDVLARLPLLDKECRVDCTIDVIVDVCNTLLLFLNNNHSQFFSLVKSHDSVKPPVENHKSQRKRKMTP